MPTQEERLTALEKTFETFRRETAARTREIEENTTIMLGVMRAQGQDIRRIFEHVYSIDNRLDTIDQRLTTVDQRLDRLEKNFDIHTALLNEHTARFDRLETLLTQVLERLPKTP